MQVNIRNYQLRITTALLCRKQTKDNIYINYFYKYQGSVTGDLGCMLNLDTFSWQARANYLRKSIFMHAK